jgi:hypothetical protein
MSNEKPKVVTLRSMGNRDISQEPEMKELKRMIRDGELDQGRTLDHVNEEPKGKEVKREGESRAFHPP